jgi:hypothetical protein
MIGCLHREDFSTAGMRSVGSDELSSGFLAGLKDLGLVVGDVETSGGKTKKTPTKSEGTDQKRRSPTRPRLNIDDLMDGIGPTSPPAEENFVLDIPKRLVPAVAKSGLQIESNISDYLSSSMIFLREEFVAEISRLLRESCSLDEQISNFGDQLKLTVRNEIAEICGEGDFPSASLLNCFDPFTPKFRALFQEVEEQSQSCSPKIVRTLKNANAEIASCGICLKGQFSPNSFTPELRDLNDHRENGRASKEVVSRKTRRLFVQHLELESEEARQKIEGEMIRVRSAQIDEDRRKLEDWEFEEENNPMGEIAMALRDLIDELETIVEKHSAHWIPDVVGKITMELDSLRSVRGQYVHALGKVTARMEAFKPPEKPTPRDVIPVPVEDRRTSPGSVPDAKLINAVQEKLKMLQEKRESDLENTSRFLSSIRRKELRRVHKQISSIINPGSP